MPSSVQPIIVTPELERLVGFYTDLFDAKEIFRVPETGPTFFVGLQIGESELGLVSDSAAQLDAPQRILLSAQVEDVDQLLPRVTQLGGDLFDVRLGHGARGWPGRCSGSSGGFRSAGPG